MKTKYLEIILTLMLLLVVVSGFAITWTQTTAGPSSTSIGMSADGRILCAAPSTSHALISTNWGLTWAPSTNGPAFNSGYLDGVAVSADGTKIFLASMTNGVTILVSTDYGNTWSALLRTNASGSGGAALACSADGTKVIAGLNNLYFSTNDGANWSTSSVPAGYWVSLASCADGSRMVGAVKGGSVYFSTNFGAAWLPANLPAQSWNSVCLSSDGTWAGATSTGNSYISSNAGATWITNKPNGNAIASSANGTNWMIAGAQVYTSIDSGVTWQTNLTTSQYYCGAVSADGCEFAVSDLYVWVGRTTPSPQMNIQSTNGNIALSWLVPSTNFVLQQNPDLSSANWVAVSNSPVLNFTNLQDQVSVPASASNGFFRLIAQ